LSSDKLKTISNKDKKKKKEDSHASSNSTTSDPKLDEMTKNLKDLNSEIAKMNWESKHPNKSFQGDGNRNQN
jgi:flagellar biosynthesis GTPase FlhF